jgi:hypothetical protein
LSRHFLRDIHCILQKLADCLLIAQKTFEKLDPAEYDGVLPFVQSCQQCFQLFAIANPRAPALHSDFEQHIQPLST